MRHKPLTESIRHANEAGVQFCLTDTETGLILLSLADTTSNSDSRTRQIGEALKAYESVLHFLERLTPNREQQIRLLERLGLLRERLVSAGIPLEALKLTAAWARYD